MVIKPRVRLCEPGVRGRRSSCTVSVSPRPLPIHVRGDTIFRTRHTPGDATMRFAFAVALAAVVLGAARCQEKPSIEKKEFGKMPDGAVIEQYTLKAGPATMKVITLGGIISALHVPDKTGKLDDVVLGFNN